MFITEDKTGSRLTDVLEIHYLELPKLKDKIKGGIYENDPTLEWMMFLEADNKEVLDMLGQRSAEIKKATSILEVMSKNKEDRILCEAREAQLHDIATNLEEAEERGVARGELKKARDTARELIRDKMEIGRIIKYTKLTKEEVEEIKQHMIN